MHLAFSTNAYLRFPFEEAADRIKALGSEGLELMADVPHAWPAGRAILWRLDRLTSVSGTTPAKEISWH